MLWHAEQPGRIPIVVDCLRSTDESPHVAPSQPWHAQTAASVPAPVPVSLVSNSGLLREGLVSVLAPHIEVRLVQSYAGGLWPGAELPNPVGHVVLVDGGIGADAGQRWVRYWRGLTPPAHVLALELVDEGDTILDYIEAGAEGYTVVGASATDVAEAIRWAQQGLARSSPQLVARVFARLAAARAAQAEPPVPGALAPVTAPELDVQR
jgi:DNA-binding NarL/FixJ family response regulator